MSRLKVPFPRYLNAKKLYYIYEYDVAVALGVSAAIVFALLVWFTVNILIAFLVAAIVAFFIKDKYIKYFKQVRRGYLSHYLYSKGFSNATNRVQSKSKKDSLKIPKGFENDFRG